MICNANGVNRQSVPRTGRESPTQGLVSGITAHRWDIAAYTLTIFLTFAAVVLVLHPWSVPPYAVFSAGGDSLFIQSSVGVASQVGPFGIDQHLGWPDGFSQWSFPQLGIYLGTLGWLLGNLLTNNWAQTSLYILAITAGLNAGACLFLFRAFIGRRLVVVACASAAVLGAAPFVIDKVGHLAIGAWFIIPLMFGVVIRGAIQSRRWRIISFALLAVVAVVSPLFWVLVGLFLAPAMLLISLVRRRWTNTLNIVVALGTFLFGFAVQFLFFLSVPHVSDDATRGSWDSNIYGGHLTDFLLASPFLNRHIPALLTLVPGSSTELRSVGLAAGVAALALLLIVLCGLPRKLVERDGKKVDVSLLADASIVSLLFFGVGLFGNLQAGFAVLLGTTSPVRVWARISIVIAILVSPATSMGPVGAVFGQVHGTT